MKGTGDACDAAGKLARMTCGVCQGTTWRRHGALYDTIARVVTEFAECQGCGASYLYQRKPTKEEARGAA